MKKAIMISANMEFTEPRYGSVLHHAIHLGKKGKVFWHVHSPGGKDVAIFRNEGIKKGYFYSTSVKKVLYTFQIEKLGPINEFSPAQDYEKFVPEWRLKDWKSTIKKPVGIWILINEIKELIHPQNIKNFEKIKPLGDSLKPGKYPYSIIIEEDLEAI